MIASAAMQLCFGVAKIRTCVEHANGAKHVPLMLMEGLVIAWAF